MTTIPAQGRGPSLYDEQLQRQHQEKRLFADFGAGKGGGRLGQRQKAPFGKSDGDDS